MTKQHPTIPLHRRVARPITIALALPGALGLFGLLVGCVRVDRTPESAEPEGFVAADVAVAWNARILDLAEAEDGFLTLKGVRSAALLHLAMHDALAAMVPRYDPFVPGAAAGAAEVRPGDQVAAANAAAYSIARSQYPDRLEVLNAERAHWAGKQGGTEAEAVGERAAAAVLATRQEDRWNEEATYVWHPMGPGVYAEFEEHSGTPNGFVFGAGWAEVTPFALRSPDQFRSPPPPDIDSDAYTRAFDEVREYGRRESALRTADEAHLAMWWKEFVEKSHNRLARELVSTDGLGLQEAVRLFARLNMAIFDGYVSSFDSKFHYNHWRPYTAIRWASHDGNPDTREEHDWTNLHDHTYAFPSYPSAHGTVCAAAMTVMESVFGASRPFEMTILAVDAAGPGSPSVRNDPPTRSFENFAEAAEECSASRVYLGIHFRYDSEAGTELGRRVGGEVLAGPLQAKGG